MTQAGKCETCRSRKVKCDEKKPTCSACSKKNRPCTYTYSRPTVFVRQDPSRLSNRGESKVAPLVCPIVSSYVKPEPWPESRGHLQLTTKEEADKGDGVFRTFAMVEDGYMPDRKAVRKKTEKCKAPFRRNIPMQPSSPDTLAARCISIFGLPTSDPNSHFINGSWIEAVPPRLGFSAVLDLAVEYAVNSFVAHREPSIAAQRAALESRSSALRSLRKAIEDYQDVPSYDVILATKIHSFAEIFFGVGTFAYATHCVGLSELLKLGSAIGLEAKHHWSLVDHTCIDEIVVAIYTGRPSIFDTDLYRSLTDPLTFRRTNNPSFEYEFESVAIMHCLIQLPRLCCLVRRSIAKPDDTRIRSSAMSLAKSLWAVSLSVAIHGLLETLTTVLPTAPSPEIKDIIPDTLCFSSVHALLVCTRFWSVQIHTCAMLQTLWHHFPGDCISASLPALDIVQKTEIQAAEYVARSLPYALQFLSILPLVPLRVLGPVALSFGPWHRQAKRLTDACELLKPTSIEFAMVSADLETAIRMEGWVLEQCNRCHDVWNVPRAEKMDYQSLMDSMAGGELWECIPNKVPWDTARMLMIRQGLDV